MNTNAMDQYENCPSYGSFDVKSFSNSPIPFTSANNNDSNNRNNNNNSNNNNSFCVIPPNHNSNNNNNTNINEKLEPEPTLDVLTHALHTLYRSNDTFQRKLAEKWLILFQKQPIAWEFCPRLLLESNIYELQYFGASTLESKLKNEWNECNVEMKSKILNTIVSVIQNSTNLPVCCITRISVTLTIAVMYTFPDIWRNAMFDVIHLAIKQDINTISLHEPSQNHFNTDRLLMVLEFLSILPDELKKQDLVLCKYNEIQKELKLIVDKIYKFLLSVLFLPITENFDFIKIGYKALSAWLKYMLPSNGTMLQSCFEISFTVGQQKVSNNSNSNNKNQIGYPLIDSLALVLEGSSLSIEGQSNGSCYIDAFRYAIEQSLSIFPTFYNEASVMNQDDSKAKPIFNVFIQFISSNNSQLFTTDLIHRCLNILISFVDIGSRETISLLFYLIDDFKTHTMLVQQDQNILKFFFLKLLNRFLEVSMYPNDKDYCPIENGSNPLSASQNAQFNGILCETNIETLLDDDIEQFRSCSSDCLMNIQENDIIPKSTFLKFLIEKLNGYINEKCPHWEQYESILYYIFAFSGGSQDGQLEYVPILLNIIPLIPIKSIPLVRTSIKLIGRYSSFLKTNTEYLGKVVSDLLPALSHSELIGSAASSLLSICISDKCSTMLWPHFNQILDQIEPTLLGPQKSNPSIILVYKSLLHILQKAPINELSPPFTRLISPVIPNVTDHIPRPKSKDHYNQLIVQLSVLYSVNEIIEYDEFATMGPNGELTSPSKHPLYPFFQTTIPIQGQLLKQYKSEFEIIDSITMFYRYMMLYFREIANDFVDEILQQATQSFNQYPIASLLQIISSIIVPKLQPLTITNIKNSISLISNTFINTLKSVTTTSTPSTTSNHDDKSNFILDFTITPDITKDYLNLLTKILKTSPQCIEPNIISTICIYIIYNLADLTKDKPTTSNCCLFLSNCFSLNNGKLQTNDPNSNKVLEQIKNEMNALFDSDPKHSYVLVYNILMNICWTPTSIQVTQHFSDVLLSFASGYPNFLKLHATNILNDPNFLKDKQINPHDKQSFLTNILKSNSTQVDYRSSVRTFSFICNDKE
ncbi:hypothetical protein RB653_004187 [Dictyostelium firmibasis]|uniref:Importin N-terminal domain-containing protein n=1 Tax=Dictyostelium firmibasis TaxID=79012 RepID=A0AAN7U0H6_9MYCE